MVDLTIALSGLRDPLKEAEGRWEELCDGCGACCQVSGTLFGCPKLDCETNRCTIYDTRHENHNFCYPISRVNVKYMHRIKALPDSCAYVRLMKGQDQLPRPVAKKKLIPFTLAGEKARGAYAKALAHWNRMWREK